MEFKTKYVGLCTPSKIYYFFWQKKGKKSWQLWRTNCNFEILKQIIEKSLPGNNLKLQTNTY